MPRVARQRRVDGDEVAARQQVLELHALHAETLGRLAREIGIEGDHLHAEAQGAASDLAADAAQAEDAEGLAEQLDALQTLLLPAAGLHRGVGHRDPARHGEQQRQGVLGDGGGVAARGVHHDDAALGGGIDVDGVDPGPGSADDFQTAGVFQRGPGDLGGAADDQTFVVAEAGRQRRLVERAGDVDLEPVLAEGVDTDGIERVGDENALHDFSAKTFCAPRTPAPKSTGWPIETSTCSSADSAVITSNSAA